MKNQTETKISYTDTFTEDGVFVRIVSAPKFDFILVDGQRLEDFNKILINNIKPEFVGMIDETVQAPWLDFVQAVLDQSGWDYEKYPSPAMYVNGTKPTRQQKRKEQRTIAKLRKID